MSTNNIQPQKGGRIGKITYPFRILGYTIGGVILVVTHWPVSAFSPLVWVVACCFLLMPHLIYGIYRFSRSNKQVEFGALLVDTFIAGMLVNLIDHAPFTTLFIVIAFPSNSLVIKGFRHFIRSILSLVAGVLLAGSINGFHFEHSPPLEVNILTAFFLGINYYYFAWSIYHNASLLRQSRREVRQQKEDLEQQNIDLERQQKEIKRQKDDILRINREIAAEKEKAEKLLHSIFPASIAERLKQGERTIADRYDRVAVLFCDIVGFSAYAKQVSPETLVLKLNDIFTVLDQICQKYGLEKIKTIGDAYMAVAGITQRVPNPALIIAEAALEMQEKVRQTSITGMDQPLDLRIGIHAGPVVAGVIGDSKFSYDLWGDTVNLASRMESHGEMGKIQCTLACYHLLKDQYEFEPRGLIDVKGIGEMNTYFLLRKKPVGELVVN